MTRITSSFSMTKERLTDLKECNGAVEYDNYIKQELAHGLLRNYSFVS